MSEADLGRKAGLKVAALFGGLFLAVFAVNGAFIYEAVRTHAGEAADNAYQRGLRYNEVLTEASREDRLRWQTDIAVSPVSRRNYVLELRVRDDGGKPVFLTHWEAVLRRPLNEKEDIPLVFREGSSGRYKADVQLPEKGQWELRAVLKRDGKTYHVVKRIIVQ